MIMHYDRKNLGQLLKSHRLQLGLSQKDVAQILGIQQSQSISNIERGTSSIPINLLRGLIQLYTMDSTAVIQQLLQDQSKFLKEKLKSPALIKGYHQTK